MIDLSMGIDLVILILQLYIKRILNIKVKVVQIGLNSTGLCI